jgi:serine/threonine-protein kinase
LHPDAIAQVYDHFVEAGRSYLLIEYIQGPDLRAYVRQHGPQSEATVAAWFEELAHVLDYLHKQEPPILHRDISPENLIVTAEGHLVVIDFGAANEFIGQATGTLVGKQSYVSPEQIRGRACPQSDLYSLGATIFFALTGNDPEPLSSCSPQAGGAAVSPQLDSLVTLCTKLDLSQRLGSAAELLDKLAHAGREVHRV